MYLRSVYFVLVFALYVYFCYDLITAYPYHFVVFGQILDSYKSTSVGNNTASVLNSNNSLSFFFNLHNFSMANGENNNAITNEFAETKFALVKPVFTDAAYDNKFYSFYKKYTSVLPHINITTDLGLLNSKITNYQAGTVNNVFECLT